MYWRRSSSATFKEFGNSCLLGLSVPLHEGEMLSASYGIDLAVCLYGLLKDEPNQGRPNLSHGPVQIMPVYLNESGCARYYAGI